MPASRQRPVDDRADAPARAPGSRARARRRRRSGARPARESRARPARTPVARSDEARPPRSRRTRSRCPGSTQPSPLRRTSGDAVGHRHGVESRRAPAREARRVAGPGRPGPVHDHGHAVARRAAPSRAAAPRTRTFDRRPLRPDDGREVARQAHRHPASAVRSPTASTSHPHRDLRPAAPARARSRTCPAPASPRPGRRPGLTSSGSVRAESIRWIASRGPSRRTVPGTTAMALQHVTRAPAAAGRRPAPARPAGRSSRARPRRTRGCTSWTCTSTPRGSSTSPGPSPPATWSAAVVSGRTRVRRIGEADSLSSSRRGPETSARTGPPVRTTVRPRGGLHA